MVRVTKKIANLKVDQEYGIQIQSWADGEEYTDSPWSTTLTFNTGNSASPPSAPSNLVLSAQGSSFVLTWDASTTNEDGSTLQDFKDYQVTVTDLNTSETKVYYVVDERFVFTKEMNESVFGSTASGVVGIPNVLAGNIQFDVKTRNQAGDLSTTPATVSVNRAPPGSFTLTDNESDVPYTASLSWDVPSGGEVFFYRVMRGPAADNLSVVTALQDTQFTQTNLPPGNYFYQVEAYDYFGGMSESNTIEITAGSGFEEDFSVPDEPTISNVATTFDSDTQTSTITFDVTGPDTADNGADTNWTNHEFYIIRWGTSATGPFEHQTIESSDNTSTYNVAIRDLQPNTVYYYGASSVSTSGQQGPFETGSITTARDTVHPDPVTGATATGSLDNITVSWDANTDSDLYKYELYVSDTAGSIQESTENEGVFHEHTITGGTKLDPGSSTAFPHSVAVDGATRYYRVRAVDLSGNAGHLSAEVSATTTDPSGFSDTDPPSDVSGVSVTGGVYYHGSSERVYADVAWTAATDDNVVGGYIISYSTDGQTTWKELVAGPDETSYRIPDLQPGVTVAVRMKAFDGAGNKSDSWTTPVTDTLTDTGGAIQQPVAITVGGAIESDDFNAATPRGYRLDNDSLEIYGDGVHGVSIILGSSGLNMNTTTDQLWFGDASEPSAGFSVNGSGQLRVGVTDPIHINGANGNIYGGASDFAGTGADWTLQGDGSATFENVTITAASAVDDKIVLNVNDNFLVRGNLVASTYTVEMAGNMAITGSLDVNNGSINLAGGDLRVTSGDIESSDSWVYGNGIGFRLINVNDATNPGVLQAQGAQIDSLTVAGTSDFGGTVTVTGTIESETAGWSINSTGQATFSNVDINGGTLDIGSNFQVTATGVMTASGVQVTGTIEGTDGYMQNMNISGVLDLTGAGEIRTAASGIRVEFDTAGLRFYDSLGDIVINLSTTTGNGTYSGDVTGATITGGILRTANSANRVEIEEVSGTGMINFHNDVGTKAAEIFYDDSLDLLRIRTDVGTLSLSSDNINLGVLNAITLNGLVFTQGSVRGIDGTTSAPSFSFENDTNTGMLRRTTGSGGLRFTIDGSEETAIIPAAMIPDSGNSMDLGLSTHRWSTVYCVSLDESSDAALKSDITSSDLGLDFVNALQPVKYKMLGGNRPHYGFTAQSVKQTMNTLGVADFGGYVDPTVNPSQAVLDEVASSEYKSLDSLPKSLRYTEFIAPLVKAVQELTARIEALEQV